MNHTPCGTLWNAALLLALAAGCDGGTSLHGDAVDAANDTEDTLGEAADDAEDAAAEAEPDSGPDADADIAADVAADVTADADVPCDLLGTWSSTLSLPSRRFSFALAGTRTDIYVMGGGSVAMEPPGPSDIVWRARPDPVTGEITHWTEEPRLPAQMMNMAAIACDGHVYVAGGGFGGGCNREVYVATIEADGGLSAWVEAGPALPEGHPDGSLACDQGRLYVVGGSGCDEAGGTTAIRYAEVQADGMLGEWRIASGHLLAIQAQIGVTILDDELYVLPGDHPMISYGVLDATGDVGRIEEFAAPTTHRGAANLVAGRCVFLLGGRLGETAIESYLVGPGAMAAGPFGAGDLPANRWAGGAVVVGEYAYYVGGLFHGGGFDPGASVADDVWFARLGGD